MKKQIKEFKCRASNAGTMMTGYKCIDEKGLKRIQELEKEKSCGKNVNGNKIKWTENKQKELDKLVYLKNNPSLGETCITMLKEWLITEVTGNQKEIESKYLSHGIYAEPFGLQRASKYFGQKFEKNETQLEDDFFTGTFDSRGESIVIDIKCPWEAHTVPYFENQPPKGYYNQLQVYMALTGLKKAALVYCLENHSEDEIDRLAEKLARKEAQQKKLLDWEVEMHHWDAAKEKLTYDNIPEEFRIKVYEFDRDDALIESMQKRVVECREYLKSNLIPLLP